MPSRAKKASQPVIPIVHMFAVKWVVSCRGTLYTYQPFTDPVRHGPVKKVLWASRCHTSKTNDLYNKTGVKITYEGLAPEPPDAQDTSIETQIDEQQPGLHTVWLCEDMFEAQLSDCWEHEDWEPSHTAMIPKINEELENVVPLTTNSCAKSKGTWLKNWLKELPRKLGLDNSNVSGTGDGAGPSGSAADMLQNVPSVFGGAQKQPNPPMSPILPNPTDNTVPLHLQKPPAKTGYNLPNRGGSRNNQQQGSNRKYLIFEFMFVYIIIIFHVYHVYRSCRECRYGSR